MNMNYELAKQLKDVGFPQEMEVADLCIFEERTYIHTGGGHLEGTGRTEGLYVEKGSTCCFDDPDLPNPFKNIYNDLVVKLPSLGDLLAALNVPPLGFIGLRDETGFWTASGWKTNRNDWITEDGKTAVEAAANLWLALNRK